jgi:cell division protein FtsB
LTAERDRIAAAERRRARAVRLGAVVIVVLLGLYATLGENGLIEQYQRWRRHGELKVALAREQELNARLRGELEALRTDDLAIERAARVELDYKRPGEVVFIVDEDDPLAGGRGAGGGGVSGDAGRFDSPGGAP